MLPLESELHLEVSTSLKDIELYSCTKTYIASRRGGITYSHLSVTHFTGLGWIYGPTGFELPT